MTDMLRASIIIDNYNYGRFLPDAIESALAQTYPHVEVIVVDDGSTDDSREIIASYRDQVLPVLKENGGQASALNAGFAVSHGDPVIFLDSDDLLEPNAVTEITPFFDDPAIVKVHWPLLQVDRGGRVVDQLPRRPLPDGDLREILVSTGPDSYLSSPMSGNAWSRRALERILPVPEETYRRGADGYLITLAPLFGPVRAVQAPLSRYRVHGDNGFWRTSVAERIDGALCRYRDRSCSLRRQLECLGVPYDVDRWSCENPYFRWLLRMQRALHSLACVIPEACHAVLVDQNEWGDDLLAGRTWLPFTERDGLYWGPPADDVAAVAELERQRQAGSHYLVIGWPAFWWLDYYAAFHQHLRTHHRCLLESDDVIVFALEDGDWQGE